MNELEKLSRRLFGEMRDATPEENKSINDYISRISNPTGINIFNLLNIPPACKYCHNYPTNGGSGICHCTLGITQVTC